MRPINNLILGTLVPVSLLSLTAAGNHATENETVDQATVAVSTRLPGPKYLGGSYSRYLAAQAALNEADRGQIFMFRKAPEELTYIGHGFSKDPATAALYRNLYHQRKDGRPHISTIVYEPNGTTLLATSEFLASAPIDTILIIDPNDVLQDVLFLEEREQEDPCLEEALASGDARDALDCLGLGGDGSDSESIFENNLLMDEPDCSKNAVVQGSRDSSQRLADVLTNPEFKDHHKRDSWNDQIETANRNVREAYSNWDELSTSTTATAKEVAVAAEQMRQTFIDSAEAYSHVYSQMEADPEIGPHLDPGPAPDGPGARPDPRCEKRDTDSARGTLFTNREFCPSRDLLKCLAEEQDPIRRITDGKCFTGPGQAGGTMLICGDNDAGIFNPLSPDANDGEGERNCNADLEPCWTDVNPIPGYQGRLHNTYIDTLDLGPLFAGICQLGCPGIEDLEQELKGP